MKTNRMWFRFLRTATAALVLLTLATPATTAQEQRQVIRQVRFARGKTSATFKGQVRPEGNRYLYFFRARKGQRLTVRLVSEDNNAVCDVYGHGAFDANPVVEKTVDWSGKLPPADAGEYSVEVISTGGLAKYVLEVSVR